MRPRIRVPILLTSFDKLRMSFPIKEVSHGHSSDEEKDERNPTTHG
jgi:hypothetical protein